MLPNLGDLLQVFSFLASDKILISGWKKYTKH